MEPVRDVLASDLCIPGWSARSVSKADQAFFETCIKLEKVVLYRSGDNDLDISVDYLGDGGDGHDRMIEKIKSEGIPHFFADLQIQCLRPVSDLEDKLSQDVIDRRKALEKQIRSSISDSVKAKAKAAKKKKLEPEKEESHANASKQTKFIFEALGMEIPNSQAEQITVLSDLIAKGGVRQIDRAGKEFHCEANAFASYPVARR